MKVKSAGLSITKSFLVFTHDSSPTGNIRLNCRFEKVKTIEKLKYGVIQFPHSFLGTQPSCFRTNGKTVKEM